jgi:hypothetical protein
MADGTEETGGERSDPQFQGDGGRDSSSRRSRFRLVDLIVVVVVLAIGLAVLVPVIQRQREAQRRSVCLNNAHQIGLALQNYASTYFNAFPPSATLFGETNPKHVGGYSFLVNLLPFMQYTSLYSCPARPIPYGSIYGAMPESNAEFLRIASTSVPDYVCPSNTNSKFQNPTGPPPHFAFTNYKALGATTRDSLLIAANPALKPPYGSASLHPDGMIYPAAGNLPMAALIDGTSHTIAIVETIDDKNSRWVVGNECTLVGLPQASSPTGTTPAAPYPFFTPPGFDNTFGDGSGVTRAGLRTFLMYDFSPGSADAGKYEDPGWAKAPPAYGPSSMHPEVAIVSFCDGSVMGLNKRCDAANLFFLITKANNDFFGGP